MLAFNQIGGTRLYQAQSAVPDGAGWAGFVVAQGSKVTQLPPALPLADALTRVDLSGTFVFSAIAPDLANPGAFVATIDTRVGIGGRLIVWLTDPSNVTAATSPSMGISNDGSQTAASLSAPIVPNGLLTVTTLNTTPIPPPGPTDEAITIQASGGYSGAALVPKLPLPKSTVALPATIAFSGPLCGCVQFEVYVQRQSLLQQLNWGFQFLAPNKGVVPPQPYGEWLPLASANSPSATDWIDFDVTVDPSDPQGLHDTNRVRTAMAFGGTNLSGDPTTLQSCYATTNGQPAYLVPVPGKSTADPAGGRLVFTLGVTGTNGFQAAPAGDFVLSQPVVSGATSLLMCGVQGTECIQFTPRAGPSGPGGDVLRFVPGQPAYAPRFPPKQASPVEPPVPQGAPLLDSTFTTSWAEFMPATAGTGGYIGQPAGFAQYGADGLINPSFKTLYGPTAVPVALATDRPFPLAPYLGAETNGPTSFDAATIDNFERGVIAPSRRSSIGPPPSVNTLRATSETALPYNATTPMGLLVAVDEANGSYERLLLGRDRVPNEMGFAGLSQPLQQAFQSGQLFMVIANGTELGEPVGAGPGVFSNCVDIGGWKLTANVGMGAYADYTNVIIVKGRHGPLYDPPPPPLPGTDPTKVVHDQSLVASPDKWVMAEEFAAPTHTNAQQMPADAPHKDELVAVSAWLQEYFRDAASQKGTPDGAYFDHFNQIAKDANWTGILVLRMEIAPPPDLAGIAAGVRNPSQFYAHHLGIEVSPVKNPGVPGAEETTGVELADASSMFGLIHYKDPSFVDPAPGAPVQPVLPDADKPYDFVLLTLKAVFADTAVQSFDSYAQLTVNELFDAPVTAMGGSGANDLNTMVLTGAYQDNGGKPVYSLTSNVDTTFSFDNNALEQVEIVGAQMTTRKSTSPIDSWFELQGFLYFGIAKSSAAPPAAFDVFSFGREENDTTSLRKGLSFAGLAVSMRYDTSQPPSTKTMQFEAGETRFDISTSTPRAKSLFQEFGLQLSGLVSGDKDAAPAYLPVIGDADFSGVDGSKWWGLRYQLDMGTPGALAGDVGLTSTLITAWTPTSSGADSYEAFLGVELPGTGGGAKLISLQNVLKLSIGQIVLTTVTGAFVLKLTDIALRFLGLLKIPPSGSTLFYLFGNPAGTGSPSGLGWYAMYWNYPASQPEIARLTAGGIGQ